VKKWSYKELDSTDLQRMHLKLADSTNYTTKTIKAGV